MCGRTFSRYLVIRFVPKVECTGVHSGGSCILDFSSKSNVRPYIQQVVGYSISDQSRMYGRTFSR